MFTYRMNKKVLNIEVFFSWINILSTFIFFNSVDLYSFTYVFRRNGHSQILFFEEQQIEVLICQESNNDFEVTYLTQHHDNFFGELKLMFIYDKENFVKFEILNDFLSQNLLENEYVYGIIKCNFELSYYLKISKDITEITEYLNFFQFDEMLTCLSLLKATKNKDYDEFIRALIYKNLISKNIDTIFKQESLARIDVSMKKDNFISAVLDFFMIKYDFYDGNLILLDKKKDIYDVKNFDKHIPYKNLFFNSFKIFCRLEIILGNFYASNLFIILLNELNIKSLIISNKDNYKILDKQFNFHILSTKIFKSIVIINFNDISSLLFLSKLNLAIPNNIEFLSFRNLIIPVNILNSFLESRKLIGLVLNEMKFTGAFPFIKDFYDSSETLEYINICYVDINSTCWNNFFMRTNVRKIILSFSSSSAEACFLKEFYASAPYKSVRYIEVRFHRASVISKKILEFLKHFTNLELLKLHGYIIEKNVEFHIPNAIECMKDLEYLEISQLNYNPDFYNFLPGKSRISVLHIYNVLLDKEAPLIDFIKNHKSLTELDFRETVITQSCLQEIFRLEHLKTFIMKSCVLELFMDDLLLEFASKRLNTLCLSHIDSNYIKYFNFVTKLDCLEYLEILNNKLLPGYLPNLSEKYNLSSKKLSYRSTILDEDIMNRMGQLGVLNELYLSKCSFIYTHFHKLGNFCKFFNSLKILDLSCVELNIEDLNYIKNFKKLIKLTIKMPDFDLIPLKNCLIFLPICQLQIFYGKQKVNYDIIRKYLFEQNFDLV
ncbi:hypothetical protein CWI39_0750p0010 [Hamiltosporidium magnivora]|uniref:Uncharacterized protein n=1 Tax=Hamiltosporidium magnivora TaxID=148818 RepID=A0A4Q9LAN9_9MICR|nr:hypothetical protein CWI39_0750p0010 [Hamiltosporidium magnivora]